MSSPQEITPSALVTLAARHRETIGLGAGFALIATGVAASDARLDTASRRVLIIGGTGLAFLSLGHGDAFPGLLQLVRGFEALKD